MQLPERLVEGLAGLLADHKPLMTAKERISAVTSLRNIRRAAKQAQAQRADRPRAAAATAVGEAESDVGSSRRAVGSRRRMKSDSTTAAADAAAITLQSEVAHQGEADGETTMPAAAHA